MAAAEFRALPAEPLSENDWDTACPLGPDDLLYGRLESGLRYTAAFETLITQSEVLELPQISEVERCLSLG